MLLSLVVVLRSSLLLILEENKVRTVQRQQSRTSLITGLESYLHRRTRPIKLSSRHVRLRKLYAESSWGRAVWRST